MQDYKSITPEFSVAGALSTGDLARFKTMGFLTVINNLPDEEVVNGFTSGAARAEAEALGIRYIHMPANGATVTDQEVIDQLAKVLSNADRPVVAHCKTGTRSAILWGLVSAQTTEPSEILAQLEAVGFELDFLEDEFEEQWDMALEKSTANSPAAAQIQPEVACGV